MPYDPNSGLYSTFAMKKGIREAISRLPLAEQQEFTSFSVIYFGKKVMGDESIDEKDIIDTNDYVKRHGVFYIAPGNKKTKAGTMLSDKQAKMNNTKTDNLLVVNDDKKDESTTTIKKNKKSFTLIFPENLSETIIDFIVKHITKILKVLGISFKFN